MHELNLLDINFATDKSSGCQLSVQADANGFSFTIFDPVQKRHVAFRKYKFENIQLTDYLLEKLQDIFDNDELLNLEFKSTNFLLYSQRSTLIPASYFDADTLPKFFEFNQVLEQDDELHYNYIEPLRSYNVFAFPKILKNLITKQFSHTIFYQQATPFIWHQLKSTGLSLTGKVFLGMNPAFFDIAVIMNGKLTLYNTFQYVNAADLLYFVMYVYKQAGLKPTESALVISGEMSMKQDYFDTLKLYIPNIRYESAAGGMLAPGLLSLAAYKYLNLINLQQCESSVEIIKEEK